MNITEISIRNRYFTIVVYLMLLLLGVTAFLSMPRTEDPPIDIPGATVVVIYPGTNPVDLEQLVADPLEEAINELDDIKVLETTIRDGIVTLGVEFLFSTDAEEKFDEVVRQVNSVRNQLPDDLYDLSVMKWSSADVVILHLALVSETASFASLEKAADRLKKDIEKVYGVRKAEVLAYPEQEVRISIDMEKMAAMNITHDHIVRAITSNNANIPGGSVKISGKTFNVKTSGSFNDLGQIENTVVSAWNGKIIYLKNVADVTFNYQDENYYGRFNGMRAIFITVQQKENMNIFSVKDGIDEVLRDFRGEPDTEMRLETVFDQSVSVDERVNGFLSNLFQGILLVGIVIILFLGIRASLMVIIAIPLSIFIGLAFNDFSGIGLQQMSIAGLVIALGLLVDNSIVIVENIQRFVSQGHKRKEAAIQGTGQLTWPIVSATVTTILAFIPIITMPDKAGRFIQSMPVTVVYTLLASLLIALTLTPFLSSMILKGEGKKVKLPAGEYLGKFINGPYNDTLSWALRNRGRVVILSLLLLAGSGALFTWVGVSFFPKAEKPQFLIRIHTPEGTNIDETDRVAVYAEGVLDTLPEVKYYATNVGHGNPRIYYNTFARSYAAHFAEIFVELRDYGPDDFQLMLGRLRSIFAGYPGARIEIREFEQGPPVEAPLAIKVTGENLDRLRTIAQDVESMVRNSPGAINVENQLSKTTTDLHFSINRDKAGMFGVPVHEIDKTIRTAVKGIAISKYRDSEGKEYDIVMRLPFRDRISVADFEKIHVASVTGRMIPLTQFGTLEFRQAPGIITHYDMERNSTVTAGIEHGYSLDEVAEQIRGQLEDYPWPEGYSYKFAGELESREESFGGMARASIIALLAIFAVLVLQFRSLSQPLIIYSAIPLAVIGSIAALYITGYSFSFSAFIGLISLIGIVINNSIILVDYTNKLLERHMDMEEALLEAGRTRFTPILLTTLTTVGGLLPLTLGGGTMWAPMGWTIIGGLLVSTALTLIVVPVLYRIFSGEKTLMG
ncbi:MAG: efflux RND transporter permease subunit [Bacteroidales bacterium]|nr:efflux RND transporter permease subunit [Bacteroidales bacterium]